MAAGPVFDALIRSLAPALQEDGFRRKGRSFYLRRNGNWAVVEFQKSLKSSSEVVVFTINLGVALSTILRFDGVDAESPPPIGRCHWSTRIGFLLPRKEDTWWRIESESDPGRLRGEIGRALDEIALPRLDALLSDNALCEYRLEGGSDGLTEIQRLRSLSILLKQEARTEELRDVLNTMRDLSEGRPTEGFARGHIKRLGILEA